MNAFPQSRWGTIAVLAGSLACLARTGGAVSVSPDELLEARRFVSQVFEGVAPDTAPRPGLEVLANYDAVQKKTRFAKPLKLAGQPLERGLFCHAPSRIVVRLPGPGQLFEAQVGLDTNEQTSGGRGSVVFRVEVAGAEAVSTPLLREGMPAVAVRVELQGATEFVLEVTDGGDGIACDQADWARSPDHAGRRQHAVAGRVARGARSHRVLGG